MTTDVTVGNEPLFGWQSPLELIARASDMREALGTRALLRDGTSFREAYIAGKFAAHLNFDTVKLLRPRTQPTPDFAIRRGEREFWFESTEADRPSRKRNLEYQAIDFSGSPRLLRDDEWISQADYADEIDRLCGQKSVKHYDKCDGLVINSNAFGIIDEHLIDEDWWMKCT